MPRRRYSGLILPEQATPATPEAGAGVIYLGTNGRPHRLSGSRSVALADAPDDIDIAITVAADAGHVVWQGGAATIPDQAVAPRQLNVAAVSVRHGSSGDPRRVAAGSVTFNVGHATLPRRDLAVVTSAGALAISAGTAAAVPVKAALTAGDIALWERWVPAGSAVVAVAELSDKRVIRPPTRGAILGSAGFGVFLSSASTTAVEISTTGRVTFVVPPSGIVDATLMAQCRTASSGGGAVVLGIKDVNSGAIIIEVDATLTSTASIITPMVRISSDIAVLTPGDTLTWTMTARKRTGDAANAVVSSPERMTVVAG